MKSLLIPCPECGKELRLRDRKMLGKQGRCPKCRHNFILEEPEEVEFELAQTSTAPQQPVPENPQFQPAPAAAVHFETAPENFATTPENAAPLFPGTPDDDIAALAQVAQPVGGVARLKEIRRKSAKRRNISIIAGSITALAIGGVVYAIQSNLSNSEPVDKPPEVTKERLAERHQIRDNADLISMFDPMQGEPQPIELLYVPFGSRIIFHLRPADLWQDTDHFNELRASFADLAVWVEESIKTICRREPSQIEEALICLLPGQKGESPRFSAVIRLVEEEKKSELILEFQGNRTDDYGYPVYVADDYAYLLKDLKTFAIAPSDLAGEMVDALRHSNLQTDGIDELMLKTDRRRHMTIIFEPRDVRTHDKMLVSEEALPILNLFLDYFSDEEIDTVAWSFHFGADDFHSDILMRNTTVTTAAKLQREMKSKIDDLPSKLVTAVGKMEPTQLGFRKLIGRFPVFMKAFSMKTLPGSEGANRFAQLTTLLPERAAPNLALAGLLAWDESTRTDFNKVKTPTKAEPTTKLPDSIIARLKMNIELEFSRTPLQEAFAYIAEESKVNIIVDGDALKFAGYTKNMPQTFNFGSAPAMKGIVEIVKKYELMCIIVDEKKKVLTVMTLPIAKDRGLTPYVLGK